MLEIVVWPAVALVGYFGTVLLFKANVRSFIDNAKSVEGPGGLKIDSSPRPQIATDPEEHVLPAPAIAAPPQPIEAAAGLPPAGPLVEQVEDTIRRDLDVRAPEDDRTQLSVSIRALALARVLLAHEANYRVIFSTQILLLKAVNDNSVRNTTQAQFWYGVFHERVPDAPITFDAWLGFLEKSGYLIVGERIPGAPSTLTIDPFGKDFLFWMIQNGISEARPG